MPSLSAGFILQLALFGPDAAEELPATARALWARSQGRIRTLSGNHALKHADPLKE